MEYEINEFVTLASEYVNNTNRNLFLTGKAGTGKTTFLTNIRQHTFKNAVVAAPTGIAGINAGGVTLHSLFHLPFGSIYSRKYYFIRWPGRAYQYTTVCIGQVENELLQTKNVAGVGFAYY